ncbi:MAG TPA: hypothetical protein VHO68_11945 [Bacteroidales bacterium]|nr:hypothetical protein [Bacteroidales bacterium]
MKTPLRLALGFLFFSSAIFCYGQDIEPYKASEIQPYQSQEIKPVKSGGIETVKSQDIEQYKSQDVKPATSQDVQMVSSKNIQQNSPESGTSVSRQSNASGSTGINMATVKSSASNVVKTSGSSANAASEQVSSGYFGLYQYWVPGTSYTTADYSNYQLVIHNSSGTGVLPGGIKINSDGTYVWNSSWDGKVIKGKWRKTGDTGYPIELVNAQEGKNWRVGKGDNGTIIIWDGSTWYNGSKIKR